MKNTAPLPHSAPPTQRLRSFAPTPFKLIKDPLPVDHYHASLSRNKRTYYQDMLKALADAPRGTLACLETAKPYAQIRKAATKLGYECHFAEENGKLYVQILSTGADK